MAESRIEGDSWSLGRPALHAGVPDAKRLFQLAISVSLRGDSNCRMSSAVRKGAEKNGAGDRRPKSIMTMGGCVRCTKTAPCPGKSRVGHLQDPPSPSLLTPSSLPPFLPKHLRSPIVDDTEDPKGRQTYLIRSVDCYAMWKAGIAIGTVALIRGALAQVVSLSPAYVAETATNTLLCLSGNYLVGDECHL